MHNRRVVYSSDGGRADSRKSAKGKAAAPSGFPDDGVVRLSREKGGRGGKTVTVVRGLPAADLEAQAADLKRLCGAGGTLRDGVIEIQGDHRERIAERLRSRGYQVKLAGG
jgi:translation initiation factor 1